MYGEASVCHMHTYMHVCTCVYELEIEISFKYLTAYWLYFQIRAE